MHSLSKEQDTWCSERANELEAEAATDYRRKNLQLTRVTDSKNFGVSETICEGNRVPINNIHQRLGWWGELFNDLFNCAASPATSVILYWSPWPVTTASPRKAEFGKDLWFLKRRRRPGPDDLIPALSKDGGDLLVEELTEILTNVQQLKYYNIVSRVDSCSYL